MNKECDSIKFPFLTGSCFLILIAVLEFLSILQLNDGLFVYTLDDPYIHLSLAQHIAKGHYGINNIESSAPSSTILWPFILTPFSNYIISPFLINLISAIATIYFFTKILQLSFDLRDKIIKNVLVTTILVLLILATNLIGLIFTGMEHSLQILLVTMIAYGLIIKIKENNIRLWFLIAIILAPLIRYENLAVSLAVTGYLLLTGHAKKSLIVLAAILILAGSFSLFLISLNLYPLPTSVFIKSYFVESGGSFHSLLFNLSMTISQRQGIVLLIGAAIIFIYMLNIKVSSRKKLAFITLAAIVAHFLFGRYDWFNRYEVYILTFSIIIIIFFAGDGLTNYIEKRGDNKNLYTVLFIASIILILSGKSYIESLFDIPLASNNIYEQQYQMHRFIVEYYKKPSGVNDLGYVSYNNAYYVLDLYGLASVESFNDRLNKDNFFWMQKLTEEKQVGLVMIYKDWFKYIPGTWIKIGSLILGKRLITPAKSRVTFYAANINEYFKIKSDLNKFIKTLPKDVHFLFEKDFKNPVIN